MYIISIITVVFNDKIGLERTIKSVLSQTYDSIEFIVIDGGSNDGSVDVIKKYEDKIDKWISEPDDGIYDAMNKGIKMATGEWLNFMNAGDVFTNPGILREVFNHDYPNEVEFLYSDYWKYFPNGNFMKHYDTDRGKGIVHHQSSIYKRSLHDIYGYYLTQRPYSVYDLLFFLSVPSKSFQKVSCEIAIVDAGGVTGHGMWVWEKSESARVLFGIKSFKSALITLLKIVIKNWLRNSIPLPIKNFIRKKIFSKKRINHQPLVNN